MKGLIGLLTTSPSGLIQPCLSGQQFARVTIAKLPNLWLARRGIKRCALMTEDEYPPLLQAGMHRMDLPELKALVVDGFPLSQRRELLWDNFVSLLRKIEGVGIPCEIWVDGSLLTQKINPDDVDFVVLIPVEVFRNANAEQAELIQQIKSRAFKKAEKLHSFVFFPAPPGDIDFKAAQSLGDQWKKDFGFSYEKKEPKGIAVIEVQP